MKFEDALTAMRDGYKVMRSSRAGTGMWVNVDKSDGKLRLMRTSEGGLYFPYTANTEDLLAEDWEFVAEEEEP